MYIIIKSLTTSNLEHIHKCKHSKEAWHYLERNYEDRSVGGKIGVFGYSVLMASNFETTSLKTSYWINVSSDNEFSPQVSYDQYWNLNMKKNLSRLMVSKKEKDENHLELSS